METVNLILGIIASASGIIAAGVGIWNSKQISQITTKNSGNMQSGNRNVQQVGDGNFNGK